MLTDRRQCEHAGRSVVETVSLAAEAGVRGVVLREKDLPRPARFELGRALWGLLAPVGGTLIVASDAGLAQELGTGWVHLATTDGVLPGLRHGRSCHTTTEVRRAVAEGAAYVTASPVFATSSKPGYGPLLEIDGLRALSADAGGVPVYALGGIDATTARACVEVCTGVAVMGAVMAARDPAAVSQSLLRTVMRERPAP